MRNQQYRHQEQHLSSLRDGLVDLDLKQQSMQQQERSAIHAQWSELVRERKEMAEWKNGIDNAIEDSKLATKAIVDRLHSSMTDSIAITRKKLRQDIATYNELVDTIDANAKGVRTFGDRIEAWKNEIHNLRDGLADDETSIRNTRELLTELDAKLKTLHRERHSLQIKWDSTPIHEDEALQFQSSRPHAPRKRDLNGSSTDTSPEKPSQSKRHQTDSLSPVDERHASPILARACVASNTSRASRLPQASSSTQQQRVRPKLGPEELRGQLPAEWAANPSRALPAEATMMRGGLAVDTTVAVRDVPESLQASWEQCVFDIGNEDQEALVNLFKACKKTKPSQQPWQMLTKAADSNVELCLTSLLRAKSASAFGRDGDTADSTSHHDQACKHCSDNRPCFRVAWMGTGGDRAGQTAKQWRITKRAPRK